MSRPATTITLTEEERAGLERLVRSSTTEQRLALRARIVLAAGAGEATEAIAQHERVIPSTVSKWRIRFARHRLAGLGDAPRPGGKRRYDETTEKRILAQLDEPPPAGCATWTGSLVAQALGERLQTPRMAGAETAGHPSPAAPELVRQHRPGVCRQSGRRCGDLPGPAQERGRALGR